MMITVKKADGSTERISLAELKKRQAETSMPAPVTAPVAVPVVSKPLAPVLPVVIKPTPAPTKVLKTEDLKPLLHEEAPDSQHAKTIVAASRGDQVSKIISSLSFKISPQLESRVRSVVQLRLKDIRSSADTLDTAARSIKDGGLGLTETQARELTDKSKPVVYIPKLEKKEIKENIVDKIIAVNAPATAPIEDLITKMVPNKSAVNVSPVRATSVSSSKTMMHDVKTKPLSMGPLDEIQFFSLVDFRRLSSKPSDAAARLKQKFLNLKEESYLLFINSWEAWHNSLLYQDYINMIDSAISQKRPLTSALGEKDKISLAEIEALINLEKDLGI